MTAVRWIERFTLERFGRLHDPLHVRRGLLAHRWGTQILGTLAQPTACRRLLSSGERLVETEAPQPHV